MQQTIRKSNIEGAITAPTSKSYAQRAVAAALLAHGTSILTNMDLCNDTRAALDVARRLGAKITHESSTYSITGGFSPIDSVLNIGESGLATRLFTPIAALSDREITITGEGSILSRPIEAMRHPLEQLGVEVITTSGKLPLTVRGKIGGGELVADGSLSSQFITGLLTALPLAENDTTLRVDNLQSIPYVDMTMEVLRHFGIYINHTDYQIFHIKGQQQYVSCNYNIEGDWSGASCMLVAGAVAGEITVRNLNNASLQADRKIMEALHKAGAHITVEGDAVTVSCSGELRGFDFDATHCPDLFPALVALAVNCVGDTVITGTDRLTHKESDRAATLASEFTKLGAIVDISSPNMMRISRGAVLPSSAITVDSHNDHRIAMATAVAALTLDVPVTILRAEAVGKSYVEFWDELQKVSR